MTKIEILLASNQTVFTTQNLAVLWNIPKMKKLWEVIKYYTRSGKIKLIKRGVYALIDPNKPYTPFELAQKIIPISYISLSSALSFYGIRFQYDSRIYALAAKSKTYHIDGKDIAYHQVKESILLHPLGLIQKGNYVIASPERAIGDTLYLYPNSGFDNIHDVNTDLLSEVAHIYGNKRVGADIKALISRIKEDNAR
jgi:predicted transcriptional regulator of viral defense system